jgi:hypothetical protein
MDPVRPESNLVRPLHYAHVIGELVGDGRIVGKEHAAAYAWAPFTLMKG